MASRIFWLNNIVVCLVTQLTATDHEAEDSTHVYKINLLNKETSRTY